MFPDTEPEEPQVQAQPGLVTMKASDFAQAASATPEVPFVTMKASDFAQALKEEKPPQLLTMHASDFAAASEKDQATGLGDAKPPLGTQLGDLLPSFPTGPARDASAFRAATHWPGGKPPLPRPEPNRAQSDFERESAGLRALTQQQRPTQEDADRGPSWRDFVPDVYVNPMLEPSKLLPDAKKGENPLLSGLRGFTQSVEGLTSPAAIATMIGTAGVGSLGRVGLALQRGVTGLFAAGAAAGVVDHGTRGYAKLQAGDVNGAAADFGMGTADGLFAALIGRATFRGLAKVAADINTAWDAWRKGGGGKPPSSGGPPAGEPPAPGTPPSPPTTEATATGEPPPTTEATGTEIASVDPKTGQVTVVRTKTGELDSDEAAALLDSIVDHHVAVQRLLNSDAAFDAAEADLLHRAAASREARDAREPGEPEPAATTETPVTRADAVSPGATGPRGAILPLSDKEEPVQHDYSSSQANLPPDHPITQAIRTFATSDELKDKLAEKRGEGEETAHITVKYGNPGTDPAPIQKALEGHGPITVTFGPLRVFPGKDGKPDALVVDVTSPDLHKLNTKVGEAVDHTGNTFPDYHPHATIAYLEPGQGAQYAGRALAGVTGQSIELNSITFSGKDGKQVEIPLTGKPEQPSGTDLDSRIAALTTELKGQERPDKFGSNTAGLPLTAAQKRLQQKFDVLGQLQQRRDWRDEEAKLRAGGDAATEDDYQSYLAGIRSHTHSDATSEFVIHLNQKSEPGNYVPNAGPRHKLAIERLVRDGILVPENDAARERGPFRIDRSKVTPSKTQAEPHTQTLKDFRNRPDALNVPKGSALAVNLDQETHQSLQRFNKEHLKVLAMVAGTSQSGSKAAIAQRIMDTWGIRKELSDATVESLEQRPGKDLRRYLDALGLWKGGNKHSQAVSIINWRTKVREDGKQNVAKGNWLNHIRRAVLRGEEIPTDVVEDLKARGNEWVLEPEGGTPPPAPNPITPPSATGPVPEAAPEQNSATTPAEVLEFGPKDSHVKITVTPRDGQFQLAATFNGRDSMGYGSAQTIFKSRAEALAAGAYWTRWHINGNAQSDVAKLPGLEGWLKGLEGDGPAKTISFARGDEEIRQQVRGWDAQPYSEAPHALPGDPQIGDVYSTPRGEQLVVWVSRKSTAKTKDRNLEVTLMHSPHPAEPERWAVAGGQKVPEGEPVRNIYTERGEEIPAPKSREEKQAAAAKEEEAETAKEEPPQTYAKGATVPMHEQIIVDGKAIKATGYNHARRRKDGSEPWEVVEYDSADTHTQHAKKINYPTIEAAQKKYGVIFERGDHTTGREKPEAAPEQKPAPPGLVPPGSWMNEWDIEEAVERYKNHPVLSRATKFLSDLREETNAHSDGWHSWKLPSHAARQLMGIIQHPEYATEANFKRALGPIRAFYTKRGNAAGMKFPDIGKAAEPKPEAPAAETKPAAPDIRPGGIAPVGTYFTTRGKLYFAEGINPEQATARMPDPFIVREYEGADPSSKSIMLRFPFIEEAEGRLGVRFDYGAKTTRVRPPKLDKPIASMTHAELEQAIRVVKDELKEWGPYLEYKRALAKSWGSFSDKGATPHRGDPRFRKYDAENRGAYLGWKRVHAEWAERLKAFQSALAAPKKPEPEGETGIAPVDEHGNFGYLMLRPPLLKAPVRSADEASEIARRWIQENDYGASDLPEGFGNITDANGKLVAKVSYNGHVWSPDGKDLLQNAFDSEPPAEAGPRGGIDQKPSPKPEGLAWTNMPGTEEIHKDYRDPTDYFDKVRLRQTRDKAYLDGHLDRMKAISGKKGAIELRRKESSEYHARQGAYDHRYTEVEHALGIRAAEQMRAEVEARQAPEDKAIPAEADFHKFWHMLRRGDTIETPQGPLTIVQAEAFHMQPILPGPTTWHGVGPAHREVSEITGQLPGQARRKFRKADLEEFLYPKEETKPAASETPTPQGHYTRKGKTEEDLRKEMEEQIASINGNIYLPPQQKRADIQSAIRRYELLVELLHEESETKPAEGETKEPFGTIYGSTEHPAFITPEGPVWMWRKGQRVRFYTAEAVQVGPEQANVAPAVFAAHAAGWIDVPLLGMREGEETKDSEPAPKETEPAAPTNKYPIKGGYILLNKDADRLQVFFDAKPDVSVRNQMKKNGFHWAPSVGAWQRQLTGNAKHAASRLFSVNLHQPPAAAAEEPADPTDTATRVITGLADKMAKEVGAGNNALRHTPENAHLHAEELQRQIASARDLLKLAAGEREKQNLRDVIASAEEFIEKAEKPERATETGGSGSPPPSGSKSAPPGMDDDEFRVREETLAKLRANPEQYLAAYTTQFGNVLNTDSAATLFPEYNESNETRAKYRMAVQPAAKWIRDELLRRALLEPGKEFAVFIGGGPGAGKSTLLRANPTIAKKSLIVFDAILSDLPGVKKLVDQVREAGRDVSVTYVHRDALNAYRGVLDRAATEGRLPSIEYFLDARKGAAQAIRGLQERHAQDPNVEVLAVENRGEEHKPEFIELDTLPLENYTELRGQLHALVESEYAAGRISETTYRQARRDEPGGVRRDAPAPEGPLGGRTGDHRTEPGPGRGIGQEGQPEDSAAGGVSPGGSTSEADVEYGKPAPKRGQDIRVGDRIFSTQYGHQTVEEILPPNPAYPKIITLRLTREIAKQFERDRIYTVESPASTAGTIAKPAEKPILDKEDHAASTQADAELPGAEDRGSPEGASPDDVPGTGEERPTGGHGNPDVGGLHGSTVRPDGDSETPPQPGGRTGPRGGVSSGRKGSAASGRKPKQRGPDLSHDYQLTDADHIGEGNLRAKAQANIDAIRILKQCESESRAATTEEQAKLAKFTGWGALSKVFESPYYVPSELKPIRAALDELLTPEEFKTAAGSTVNAHYTSPMVIGAMWEAMRHLGMEGGERVLEPSMGVGNFFGLMPEDLRNGSPRTGVELDHITGGIAKLLYPGSNVHVAGLEKVPLANDFFDVAIGNVPFGNYQVSDPEFRTGPVKSFSIHNYFFAKALAKVREGGVVAFITSSHTMDAEGEQVRKYLAEHADLLGAIRLPHNAFKENAGTQVTTDIIFLRKRAPGAEPAGEPWIRTRQVEAPDKRTNYSSGNAAIPLNEYYVAHPEMMLGSMIVRQGQGGRQVNALDGDLTPEALAKAIANLPEGALAKAAPSEAEPEVRIPLSNLPDPSVVKDGGYVHKDGQILIREGNELKPSPLKDTQVPRVRGMLAVRDAWRNVLRKQEQGTDAEAKAARKLLNQAYDVFVQRHGPLSNRENTRAFAADPDAPGLLALEDYDTKSKTAKKADIFRKTTNPRYVPPETAPDAASALAIALNEYGGINWARIQKLTGLDREGAEKELTDNGLVYRNPEGGKFETADEYLSGEVRDKLKAAIAAAESDPDYEPNVEALKKVQPEDLGPGEIDARLGANWIPKDVIAQFLTEKLKVSRVKVGHAEAIATWNVQVGGDVLNATNTVEFGGFGWTGVDLVEEAMNLKSPTVRVEGDTPGSTVVDPVATAALREKQQQLKDSFRKWIWEDAARATRLARIYNDGYNNLRLRQFDGSHLKFPGMNESVKLRDHQKNAIWRMLQGGNTLLAHVVGAGKTYAMVAAAMEMRRLGTAKKPMFVVPNHLVQQWAAEFMRLYPNANLFVAGKETFSKGNRQQAMSRVANGDYDAVIVSHSSFGKLPVSDDTFNAWMEDQVQELVDAITEVAAIEGSKSPTVKDLQKAIKRLEARIDKRAKREKKDQTITFEEMGVDQLFVDESDLYKNLAFTTKMTRIAGLPNSESDRAIDMYLKTQWLTKKRAGAGVVFATGTPIANTMAEMYTVQRYLQGRQLKESGLGHFDAWASQYGEGVTSLELAPDGSGYRMNTRFSRFVNLPELSTAFRVSADVQTADMLKLPVPNLKGGKPIIVAAEASEAQKRFIGDDKAVGSLVYRAGHLPKGPPQKGADNMLAIVGDGRKCALDMRLVHPDALDNPDGKVNKAVDRIFAVWERSKAQHSTQLVFSDLSTPNGRGFNVYTDARDKLIARGIPAEEIAFIHDYDTDAQKKKLYDAVNDGRIRILFGSTEKMGAGMNVQKKLIALHHLDAPWRPRDIEQREGRILRQGNENAEVEIYRYVTAGSFDAYMWQTLEAKARFIAQVMTGNSGVRVAEDIESNALTYAEIKGIASGNPKVMEKIKVDIEVRRLDGLRSAYQNQLYKMRLDAADSPRVSSFQQESLAQSKEDQARRENAPDELWRFGGETFSGKDANARAGAKLHELLEAERKEYQAYEDQTDAIRARHFGELDEALKDESLSDYKRQKLTKQAKDKIVQELSGIPAWNRRKLGTYRGFDLWTSETHAYRTEIIAGQPVKVARLADISIKGTKNYFGSTNEDGNPLGTLASIRYKIDSIDQDIEAIQRILTEQGKKLADLQALIDRPFEHESRLAELLKQQQTLNSELDLNKNLAGTEGMEQKEQEIEKAVDEEEEEEESAPSYISDPHAPADPRRLEFLHNRLREEQHKPEPNAAKIENLRGRLQKLGESFWTEERSGLPADDKPDFSRVIPGFYSQLDRAIADKMPAKAAPTQVLAILRNPQNGVKPDEDKWIGLSDWLMRQKGPVTREQVLEFVKANNVRVEEVVRGTDDIDVEKFGDAVEHAASEWTGLDWSESDGDTDYTYDESDAEKDEDELALEIAHHDGWHGDEDQTEDLDEDNAGERSEDEGTPKVPFKYVRTARDILKRLQEVASDAEAAAEHGREAVKLLRSGDVDGALDEIQQASRLESEYGDDPQWSVPRQLLEGMQDRGTKFGLRVLPGGENYRELLLTLPEKHSELVTWSDPETRVYNLARNGLSARETVQEWTSSDGNATIRTDPERGFVINSPLVQNAAQPTLAKAMAFYQEQQHAAESQYRNRSQEVGNYRSSHWGEPNVLAHIRFNDRTGPNGEKILHVEEIQSDWHQAGRKKGYRVAPPLSEEETTELRKRLRESDYLGFRDEGTALNAIGGHADWPERWDIQDPRTIELGNRHRAVWQDQYGGAVPGAVPAAPFAKTWHELAFKRALRWAAENGYDQLTWTTGEQQAERYDLSKQVSRLTWEATGDGDGQLAAYDLGGKRVFFEATTEGKLPDYIGKDVAEKLIAQKPSERDPSKQELSGLELKVGGEGMKGFYDQILPAYASKLGKKWGAKAGTTQIPTKGLKVADLKLFPGRDLGRLGNLLDGVGNLGFGSNREARNAIATHADWATRWDVTQPEHRELRELGERYRAARQKTDTVHMLPITPTMRESVMEGQPLFAQSPRGWDSVVAFPAADGPATAQYRRSRNGGPGVVYVNRAGADAIARFYKVPPINGARVEPHQVNALIAGLRENAPELADAILEAAWDDRRGQVVIAAKSGLLAGTIATVRHEKFHAYQSDLRNRPGPHDHLGKHEEEFLAHPAAEPAVKRLREIGYSDDQTAIEIGARLAAGQYEEMGLTRDQAKALWFHYTTLLGRHHGADALQAMRNIAPMMRERLHAAIRAAKREAQNDTEQQADSGEPGQRNRRGEERPRGVGQGVRRNVSRETPEFSRQVAPSNRVAEVFDSTREDTLKTFAPRLLSADANTAGLSLREHAARSAQTFARAEKALEEARKLFSRRPWNQNLDFINRVETGDPQPDAALQAIADVMRGLLDSHREAVQKLGKNKLTTFYENYFPHLWNRSKDAESTFRAIFGKRPIEGTKGFLKQRKFQSFQEGVDAGLVPVSENPVDLVLLKLKEMERYTLAHTFLAEMKEIGLAKFVGATSKKRAPEDWVKIPDQIGTVWAPPFVKIPEAHDKEFMDTLLGLASDLGMNVQRVAKLRSAWGRAFKGSNTAKTRFAGPESVILHEVGHLLDWRYDLGEQIINNPEFKKELRDLADLRLVGNDTQYFQQYVRRGEEKIANMIAAYGHAPARFKKVAPKTFAWFRGFIKSHPELAPLSKLGYGMQQVVHTTEYPVGGFIQMGNYYMPSGAAQIISNYLSPGLGGKPWYQALRGSSNMMLQFALGFSGFHAGFTTMDAAVSKLAIALQYLAAGKPVQAAKHAALIPASTVTNILKGGKIRNAYLRASLQDPELTKYVEAIVQGGGRVTMDAQYRSNMRQKFLDAWHKHTVGMAALTALPALAELAVWPVLEWLVPRQKLAVFADMVDFELERLGPNATKEQVRQAFSGAWDSVDNRMGQLVYDDLFWDRTVKDVMMISVQSVGWNLGTLREFGGAAGDTVKFGKDVAGIIRGGGGGRGGRGGGSGGGSGGAGAGAAKSGSPEFTRRMAYALALTILTGILGAITDYANTKGRKKADGSIDDGHDRDWRDYFFPRTGNVDEHGKEERMALPGYLKDLVAWYMEPVASARNKLSPIVRLVAETTSNENFYKEKLWDGENRSIPENIQVELKHMASFFVPMSVSGLLRERGRGAGAGMQAGQMLGLRTAASYVTRTPAERYMAEYAAQHRMTAAPTAASKIEREIATALRAGHNDQAIEIAEKATKEGKIGDKELQRAIASSMSDPLTTAYNRLPLSNAIEAVTLMNPAERQKALPLLEKKLEGIDNLPVAEQQRVMERLTQAGILH